MSQMRATLRWELQDALIFAPRDEENVNIILANVYRSLDPEFGRRAVGSAEGTGSKELARHTFSHIVHELVNSAIIDREEVDQAFLAINPRKFAGVVRSYTQQRFWTEAFVSRHREIPRLQDRIAVLERTVANTERVMCLVNALRSVSEGVNSVSDSVVIFNNIASKLGCGEEVIRQSNNQLRLMSVDGDIRRLSGIEAILSEKQFDFLAPLVPTTLETGHNTFRYKDDKAYPLEQTLRFRASEDDIPLVRDSARSIGIDADVSVEGAFMTVFYNSVTARDAHIPHLKTLGFTLKKLTSATWQYVQEAHFDLRAHFEKLVAYPQAACLTVKERDAVSAALNQQRSHVDPDEQPRTIPLVLIVWFDAWKSQTTALKCRFYDPNGFVFPSILTPPFRVLEYQGKESDIRSHFSVVDQIIDMACKAVPKVRDTRHYCSIEKLILIADHPAMAKMIGTTCGGDYPSPFQPIHAANKGWSPFGVRYRLSLYDVVKAKQMVSDAEPGVDLTLEWGSFKAKKEKVIRPTMLASTEIPLSEVYISPPIMHISHDLIEQFGNIFKMFPSYTVEGRGEERASSWRLISGALIPGASSLAPHLWRLIPGASSLAPSSLAPHLWRLILAPHPWRLIPGASFLAPHPWRLIPGASSMAPHPWRLIPGASSLAPHPGASSLAPHPWRLIPGASSLAPHPWRLISGASSLAPHPWRLIPGASSLAPHPWRLIPGASSLAPHPGASSLAPHPWRLIPGASSWRLIPGASSLAPSSLAPHLWRLILAPHPWRLIPGASSMAPHPWLPHPGASSLAPTQHPYASAICATPTPQPPAPRQPRITGALNSKFHHPHHSLTTSTTRLPPTAMAKSALMSPVPTQLAYASQ
ncbi:hypothetical protein J8273_1813 [Carpediemonas membranifera]|uniref:Uncharacterized protein n=1 Tax=Carpediemonas membranifera TaxID=201153 RepID=A0A8J6EBB7_9EUKA|nr:hypothetical protein J8273_1813 [Carpediemonas membranifera]|eukprot:KAG9396775.1 hypothetical protein J8273_1813 [Carpediemonas membranifera]